MRENISHDRNSTQSIPIPPLHAPFWSLRSVEETRELLAVRQDTIEPPRLAIDRGAMLTAVTDGGYGYCATGDLSPAGLQAALDRATAWAELTRKASVYRYNPADMPAPKGERSASATRPLFRAASYTICSRTNAAKRASTSASWSATRRSSSASWSSSI